MTEYKPQKGDRVRVTVEGEVVWENDLWAHIHTTEGLVSTSLRLRKEEGVTIEKLADPEPTWVNGDVVRNKTTGHAMLMNRSGHWVCSCRSAGKYAGATEPSGHVTANWQAGNLEILYKADAEREVA